MVHSPQIHCIIKQDPYCMIIYPQSREPTFVNGTRIPDSVPLRPDDIITIGRSYKFQFVVPYNKRPVDAEEDARNSYRQPFNKRPVYAPSLDDRQSVSTENVETVFGVAGNIERISTIRKVTIASYYIPFLLFFLQRTMILVLLNRFTTIL